MSLYTFGQVFCGAVVRLFFRMRCEGIENLPAEGGFVLASNHRTDFDPIFVGIFPKRQLFFMAKEELFRTKLGAKLFTGLGAIPVRRGKNDTSAIEKSIQTVEDGNILAIFPEGTRSKDGKLLKLKSGAVLIASQTGSDIVPTAVVFKGKHLCPFKKVTVRYGKPIPNEQIRVNGKNASDLKNACRVLTERITELLEAP